MGYDPGRNEQREARKGAARPLRTVLRSTTRCTQRLPPPGVTHASPRHGEGPVRQSPLPHYTSSWICEGIEPRPRDHGASRSGLCRAGPCDYQFRAKGSRAERTRGRGTPRLTGWPRRAGVTACGMTGGGGTGRVAMEPGRWAGSCRRCRRQANTHPDRWYRTNGGYDLAAASFLRRHARDWVKCVRTGEHVCRPPRSRQRSTRYGSRHGICQWRPGRDPGSGSVARAMA